MMTRMRLEEAKRVVMLSERRFKLTFEQFERLHELGILVGRLELLDGEIGRDGFVYRLDTDDLLEMYSAGLLTQDTELELIEGELFHATAPHAHQLEQITKIAQTVQQCLKDRAVIRQRTLLPLSARNALIADVIVQRKPQNRFEVRAPSVGDASVVIDVSDGRSQTECELRLEQYARHHVTEVWTVTERGVQIHRDAHNDRFGTVSPARDAVLTLEFPDAEIRWW